MRKTVMPFMRNVPPSPAGGRGAGGEGVSMLPTFAKPLTPALSRLREREQTGMTSTGPFWDHPRPRALHA